MANLGFVTKTYAGVDWGQPDSNGQILLNTNSSTGPVYPTWTPSGGGSPIPYDTIVFPYPLLQQGWQIGVQSYFMTFDNSTNSQTNKYVAGLTWGWGLINDQVIGGFGGPNSIQFSPHLQLLGNSTKMNSSTYDGEINSRRAHLTLSIVVQYDV